MILILSPTAEKTVNDVINWLAFLRKPFLRITEQTPPSLETSLQNGQISFSINDITDDQILAFWIRKGHFTYSTTLASRAEETLPKRLLAYLSLEFDILADFVIQQLENKRYLGNYFYRNPNKLRHLQLAQEANLAIPQTLVTAQRDSLQAFQEKTGPLINKSIKDSFRATHETTYYYNHTEGVSGQVIADMPDVFFPSLVQAEIAKKYELRVVFVGEMVWSMAIFSQNDPQTKTDWRNYNHQRPNRTVPYQLPESVTLSIRKFIQKSGLNMGAIDMIVSKEGEYIFLECNPNGQISMVSETCNYPIEKHIATYLAYGTEPISITRRGITPFVSVAHS